MTRWGWLELVQNNKLFPTKTLYAENITFDENGILIRCTVPTNGKRFQITWTYHDLGKIDM